MNRVPNGARRFPAGGASRCAASRANSVLFSHVARVVYWLIRLCMTSRLNRSMPPSEMKTNCKVMACSNAARASGTVDPHLPHRWQELRRSAAPRTARLITHDDCGAGRDKVGSARHKARARELQTVRTPTHGRDLTHRFGRPVALAAAFPRSFLDRDDQGPDRRHLSAAAKLANQFLADPALPRHTPTGSARRLGLALPGNWPTSFPLLAHKLPSHQCRPAA